jgi:hypothetical protein
MRRRTARPLAPAFERVADALRPATLLAEVQRVWDGVAGDALAASCTPVAERDGVVTVACGSGVWAQELDLMSELLADRLNDALGRPAVRRLRAVATPPPR